MLFFPTEEEEVDVRDLGHMTGPLCEEVAAAGGSLSFLHDGSPHALRLLHFILVHYLSSNNPRQVISLDHMSEGEGERAFEYGLNHKLESGLVVVVFENATLVQSLLGTDMVQERLFNGPLLLLALSHHQNNRYITIMCFIFTFLVLLCSSTLHGQTTTPLRSQTTLK